MTNRLADLRRLSVLAALLFFLIFVSETLASPVPTPGPAAALPARRAPVAAAPRALATPAPLNIRVPAGFSDAVRKAWLADRGKNDLAPVVLPHPRAGGPTPAMARQQQPYPSFPADIDSCPKCQADYSGLSSCMAAAPAFANVSAIFQNPATFISVIRTDQCTYLGTDPQGTGAGSFVTNVRQVCGFASALLGHAASANGHQSGWYTPSSAPTYTDVSPSNYGPGYNDQATGAMFGSSASPPPRLSVLEPAMALRLLAGAAFAVGGGLWIL